NCMRPRQAKDGRAWQGEISAEAGTGKPVQKGDPLPPNGPRPMVKTCIFSRNPTHSANCCWRAEGGAPVSGECVQNSQAQCNRFFPPRRVHFRERGNLAKYSAASRKSISFKVLHSSSTLPTAL